jgi:hypothetical protein
LERLERKLEERASEVQASAQAFAEQRGTEALGSMSVKLEAQRTEAERRLEQLQREMSGLSSAVDAVKDTRRRSASEASLGEATLQQVKQK